MKIEREKATLLESDPRFPEIAYCEYLKGTENIHADIDELVCYLAPLFDKYFFCSGMYIDLNENLKGVRLRNDRAQHQLTEAVRYPASQVKSPETTQNYRKFLSLLSSDYYSKYMTVRETFYSLKSDLQTLKARDSDRTTLFDDFVRNLDKGILKEINCESDYYPNIDVEQLAEKVDRLQTRFKHMLTNFFLEM